MEKYTVKWVKENYPPEDLIKLTSAYKQVKKTEKERINEGARIKREELAKKVFNRGLKKYSMFNLGLMNCWRS